MLFFILAKRLNIDYINIQGLVIKMNLYELVNRYYSNLNANDFMIWEYISNNFEKCANMNIDDLASHCNFSKASIVRFAKKLNLSGYSELKFEIKSHLQETNKLQAKGNVELICNGYIQAINELKDQNFDETCSLLYNAKKIYTYGTGVVQSNACRELQRMFCNEGIYLFHLDQKINFNAIDKNLSADDVVIIISMGGESSKGIELAKYLKLKGVHTISVTKKKNNTLASLCDNNVYFMTSKFNMYATSENLFDSGTILFVVCEVFFLKYQEYCKKINTVKLP